MGLLLKKHRWKIWWWLRCTTLSLWEWLAKFRQAVPSYRRRNECEANTALRTSDVARNDIPTAVCINITVFWYMTPCNLVNIYRNFRGVGGYTNENSRFHEQNFWARRGIAGIGFAISKVAQFWLVSVRVTVLFVISLFFTDFESSCISPTADRWGFVSCSAVKVSTFLYLTSRCTHAFTRVDEHP